MRSKSTPSSLRLRLASSIVLFRQCQQVARRGYLTFRPLTFSARTLRTSQPDRTLPSHSTCLLTTYACNHPPRLHNVTAIITGSSSGLGRATALQFASHGTSLVVCADLSPTPQAFGPEGEDDSRVATHDLINAIYGPDKAMFVKTNVSRAADCKNMVDQALAHPSSLGRIDTLVNSAGLGSPSGSPLLHELEKEDWDRIIDVNLGGTFLTNKYILKQMITQIPRPLSSSSTALSSSPPPETGTGHAQAPEDHPLARKGSIINISSMLSTIALPNGTAAYCASKGGVLNLTKQLALDYAKHKINVNAVCPGFLKTAMTRGNWSDEVVDAGMVSSTPWGRWGRVEDVARVIVALASEDGAWIAGEGVVVDGGYSAQ